ncbi:G-protein coupled receptor 4-like [Engraulis encrasicolus]|uniref:G-protein coupled receptor 4-like n=1 Tax=Engraulis encrasicolus TaxID=184585 RepID=UPI002FD631C3
MAVSWVVFFTAFPGICFALYKFRSQVRPDQVAPVYVINLLISDLIQVCTNPVKTTLLYYCLLKDLLFSNRIYLFGVQVNIFFMMCISAERYVMIAHAVWYRNIQNLVTQLTYSFLVEETISGYVTCAILLVPYPLVMFFFLATWRALSRSSVPRNDQIRIRAILGLILCIYTILFIPFIMLMIMTRNRGQT